MIRKANIDDIRQLCTFTDYWLAGRGKARGAPGAVNDTFISPGQHKKYIERYEVWLCLQGEQIVGWAVKENRDVLIHMLVAGDLRGCGIGSQMMQVINPRFVRSKIDQSSGDPIEFYLKLGYKKVDTVRSHSRFDIEKISPNRKKNIDILERQEE